MESWQLGALLGLLVAINFGLIIRLEFCHRGLISALDLARSELVSKISGGTPVDIPSDLIKNLKDDLQESVMDIIGGMRTPTAVDHLAGVFANVMQMREQWKIQKEASQMSESLISPPTVGTDYGTTSHEENYPPTT